MNDIRGMMNMNDLRFEPMSGHERGLILRLLQESYRGLPGIDEDLLRGWARGWKRYDGDVFNHPDTIGACGFIAYQGESVIGFASWDPRQHPTAIVGHNCILPASRRNGLGKRQMEELLRRLESLGFTEARVTTGDHPAFAAARRMYLACGFHETGRFSSDEDTGWRMVEFEKELADQRL